MTRSKNLDSEIDVRDKRQVKFTRSDYIVRDVSDLDRTDFQIVSELVKDSEISSDAIASKYKKPLSTVQRTRKRLEKSTLIKKYSLALFRMGWRIADFAIAVRSGMSEQIATTLIENHKRNIMSASLRIGDPRVDIIAQACYRTTKELHDLLNEIKAIPYVKDADFSELVRVEGSNESRMIDLFFDKREEKLHC